MKKCFHIEVHNMKKQALFVLMLSSLILSACNNPVAPSESNRSEPSSGEQQPSSQSSEPSSQSSSQSSSSSYSGEPSGVALDLTAPENDIHTDLQYSYLKDPDWRNIKAYIPTTGADGGNKGDK